MSFGCNTNSLAPIPLAEISVRIFEESDSRGRLSKHHNIGNRDISLSEILAKYAPRNA